jgi:ABC-type amino acid transport substrate-binding protein
MTRHRPLAIVCVLLAALPAGCGGPGGAADRPSLLDDIAARGVLRVGVECVYKGTCYVDPATGRRVGYSVELTELLAKDLGVEVQWIDLEWTALIPAIQTGRVDVITQGMTNTPDRAKVVEMTDPIDYYPGVLVLPDSSPLHQVDSLDAVLRALDTPQHVVTFLLGGAQDRATRQMLPAATHVGLDIAAAYMEVATGRAHGMFADAGDAWDMIRENPGGRIWRDQLAYSNHGGMVVRPGDQRFLNWLNHWIDFYTANQTLRTLKLKWYVARNVPQWMRVLPPGGP